MSNLRRLVLIRHGETDMNRELRFQGQVNVGLNATGLEQAQRLAGRIKGEPARAIYVSDLLRARQTADPIAGELSLQAFPESGLREQNFGIGEGLRGDEIQARHPRAWEDWLLFQADRGLPGGHPQFTVGDTPLLEVDRAVPRRWLGGGRGAGPQGEVLHHEGGRSSCAHLVLPTSEVDAFDQVPAGAQW